MTESSRNTFNQAPHLPADFLGLDQSKLAVSAARQRSMADLKSAQERQNNDFQLSGTLGGGYRAYEDPDVWRHVNRGASLTQILLEDSVLNFINQTEEDFATHQFALKPPTVSRSPEFEQAIKDLTEARRKAVLGDMWAENNIMAPQEVVQYKDRYAEQLESALSASGLGTSFETAVRGLTGSGLEEPTRLPDAQYGAALIVLGLGSIGVASRQE